MKRSESHLAPILGLLVALVGAGLFWGCVVVLALRRVPLW